MLPLKWTTRKAYRDSNNKCTESKNKKRRKNNSNKPKKTLTSKHSIHKELKAKKAKRKRKRKKSKLWSKLRKDSKVQFHGVSTFDSSQVQEDLSPQ